MTTEETPASLPECNEALDSVNALISGLPTFDSQAWDFGYTVDAVDYILAIIATVVFIVLLFDRIVGIAHGPTNRTFWLAVISQNLYNVVNILSNKWSWTAEGTGLYLYYYSRALFAAVNEFAIICLLYFRVCDAIRRILGTRWMNLCLAATIVVLPLEFFKEIYGVAKLQVTGDVQNLYPPALVNTATAYRVALDLCFALYSFQFIRGAPGSEKYGHGLISEDKAFLLGYVFRVLFFLAADVLVIVVTQLQITYHDLELSSMTLWTCARVMIVIKPFLICTDMARVRALSASGAAGAGSNSSPGATKAMSKGESSASAVYHKPSVSVA
ncbi:hypothetical protein HDU86_005954 [Geranomyces michiganensis]|nr:hypothetical protein HDU86_005954 [Geranomyces michiganensis]